MINNRLQKLFKINNQLNKSIYFRSYSSSINDINLISELNNINNNNINNNELNNINSNSINDNIIQRESNFKLLDRDDEEDYFKRKIKTKYNNGVDYMRKESKGTLIYYFNGFKNDIERITLEISFYLKATVNQIPVLQLYDGLHGTLKMNPLVVNLFLKFFKTKMNTISFRYIMNSFSVDNWNSATWGQVLEFEIRKIILDEADCDKFIVEKLINQIRSKKVEFSNDILISLINYNIHQSDYRSVKFYLQILKVEKLQFISGEKMTFPFPALSNFTEILIDMYPLETINIIKTLFQRNGAPMLEDIKFPQLIHTLVRLNRTDEFLNIWQSIPEKSKTLLAYNRVIEYFAMVDKNPDLANIFLQKLMEHHTPTLESIEPILKISIIKEESESKIMEILKTINTLNLELTPSIYYWFLKAYNRERMANRLLRDSESFAKVFVVCDKINDEEHNRIKTLLLDVMAKSISPHSFLDAIIYENLYNDDFQGALSWYSTKIKSFDMFPTYEILYAFVHYHNIKNETELAQHFKSQIKTATGKLINEERVKNNFKKNYLKKDRLDQITNWLTLKSPLEKSIDEMNFQSDFFIESNKFKESILAHKLHLNNTITFQNNLLEKALQLKNNTKEIKSELEKSIENQRLPQLETLFKMLDTIYLSDPSGFLSYVLSLNSPSSVLLPIYCYSTIVKFDIEYGLIQMEPAFKATSLTISLWSALIINVVRQGYFDIVFKILYYLKNSKKILTNQALFILGQEIQNIRFKKNNINFNYNENLLLDYYDKGIDPNLFEIQRDGKLNNYYLNNYTQSQVNDLYSIILNKKVSIFSLYQKIEDQSNHFTSRPKHMKTTSSKTTTTTTDHNNYFTPFKNSCISILIDTGDFENANLLLSRLIESGHYNRETLLLFVENLRKSKENTDESMITYQLKATLTPLSKSLNIPSKHLYQLTDDPNVYQNSRFIRSYLKVPQIDLICELRNQTNSYSVLVAMDKAGEDKIYNLIDTNKII
ncbi:hypothetical protein ACTFIV_010524 [Dictyostelium citrinum]